MIGSLSVAAASSGAIPIPFADVAIMIGLIATTVIKIASFFGYAWNKISKNDIISIMNGEDYVKTEKEKDEEYEKTDKVKIIPTQVVVFDLIKGVMMQSFITAAGLLVDDGIKCIPIIGTILGVIVGAAVDFGMLILYGHVYHFFLVKIVFIIEIDLFYI